LVTHDCPISQRAYFMVKVQTLASVLISKYYVRCATLEYYTRRMFTVLKSSKCANKAFFMISVAVFGMSPHTKQPVTTSYSGMQRIYPMSCSQIQ
jgi:hypothetical protein